MRRAGQLFGLILLASTALAVTNRGSSDAAVPPLPFDMPPAEDLRASDRRVYAHYLPVFPISVDNRPADEDYYATQFLAPDGEGGKHAAYGGFLRDRPLPREVDPSPDWELEDMRTDVERATEAGLDGFVVDVFGLAGSNWDRVVLLLDAASDVDPAFDIILAPGANTGVVDDPDALADAMAGLADHPSAARDGIGRLLIAPFLAEAVGADYWAAWIASMAERGIEVAFAPILLDYGRSIDDFAGLSVAASVWGPRSLEGIDDLTAIGNDAAARGLVWMQPVAMQDNRPKDGVFDEADNTETLRAMWATADAVDARWVDIVSWNDYSESTQIAPSTNTGWALLDLNAYYLVAFKTGTSPPIVRDRIFVSHRIQAADAVPSGEQTVLMASRAGSSPPNDEVEVLTFLRNGATVDVQVGASTYTYEAPAGVHAALFPLEPGVVAVRSTAADDQIATVTSPYAVLADPEVQDLEYRVVASGRDGEHIDAAVTQAPSAVPSTSTDAIVPTGDSPGPTSDVPATDDPSASSVPTVQNASDDETGPAWIIVAIVAAVVVAFGAFIAGSRAGRRRRSRPRPTDRAAG